ncbi:hypothetical protein E2C11_11060 [Streptomyces lavendulae]|nr:hypothetical protein [Streptomyces lavendulae]TXJ80679.1 hypothetical protein E2C11_11060 [Streptomyces lavendulae]
MPNMELTDIAALLLPDGWHDVQPGTINVADQGGIRLHHSGAWIAGSVMTTNATVTFTNTGGQRITAASAAVLAVRHVN